MDVLTHDLPSPSVQDLVDMRWRREFEEMVMPLARDFIDTGRDWKNRIRQVRALYRGDWEVAYPDGTVRVDLPKTANPVQTGLDDLSHLAVENEAQHHVPPTDTDAPAIANAELRAHVLDGYWYFNEGESMAPQFVFDLAGTGGCFFSVTAKDGFDYPVYTRLDPDNSYPDVVNGVMVTFLYVQRMPIRHAKALYGVDYGGVADCREVEIIDYYDKDRHMRGSTGLNGQSEWLQGSARVLSYTAHELECTPIGWAKLPTLDGAWRGIYDQAGGGMLAKNRILQLTLDYADQLVYAPMFAHDVENDTDPPSPKTLYRLRTAEGKIGRVAPAGNSPELFQLFGMLEQEGNRASMMPAARAGEVHQSIASAAFVTSTLGQLTSVIRVLQRELANARQRGNWVAMKLDETYLDFNKPLVMNAGRRDTYTPSTAIAGRYEHRVLYGAGAGLDALNKKVAILQDLGARLISRDTARDQLDYLGDKVTEALKVDREMVGDALSQRLATENDLSVLMNLMRLMLAGQDFAQASGVMAPMVEQNMLNQMAGAMGAQGALGAGPGGPPSAAQQQLALAAGATGPPQGVGGPGVPAGAPTQPVQFPAPPMEQVMVRPVTQRGP